MTGTIDGPRQMLVRRAMFLVPIAAIGAWLAFALAVSGVVRKSDPPTALKFVPMEAVAMAARAEQLLFATPQAARNPPPAVKALAIKSLQQQAINPTALRVLGYYASAKGQEPLARDHIRLAASQSRRDSGAQLFLLEDAVIRGDVNEALQHYDIALRTRPSTQTLLFPILLAAIDDPVIRKALTPYIRSDRLWVQTFLAHANTASTDLPSLVALIVEAGGFGNREVAHRLNLKLLTRLVSEKRFAEARRLYLAMPGAQPTSLTDARFVEADRDARFGPMGWQVVINPESGSSFVANSDGRSVLTIFANPATTATVASKLLYLQPEQYDFAARLAGAPSGDGSALRWQLRCATAAGDRPIWMLESRGATASGKLTVPAGCNAQYLDIVVSGGAEQSGLEASIVDVRLSKG